MQLAFYALCVAMFIVVLLVLPIISPGRWSRIFSSNLVKWLSTHVSTGFYIVLLMQGLIFADAVRVALEQRRAKAEMGTVTNSHVEEHINMRLFRAQRDFYIAGFSLFLVFVIRRLVSMLIDNARLEAKLTAALRQAEGASRAALDMASTASRPAAGSDGGKDKDTTANNLRNELEEATNERNKLRKELEAMRRQAKGVAAEYDRLTDEYAKLERQHRICSGGSGSSPAKKDE